MVPVKLKEAAPFYRLRFNSPFLFSSSPILSSFIKRNGKVNLSEAPMTSAIPDSIFLLLILTVTFQSQLGKTVSYNCTNSTSCHNDLDPTSITLKNSKTSF
jgi:hypothetical protein